MKSNEKIDMGSDARPRLIADIGGTNARFAIYVNGQVRDTLVFSCADYRDLVSAIRDYLKKIKFDAQLFEASMAVAAPLQGDRIRMTNHAWQFSAAETRAQLKLERLIVLNDFTALAMSLRHLPKKELLQVGGTEADANGPIALIGPGTGLGVSGLIAHDDVWLPLQGEGGHATLPACNDRQAQVIAQLRSRYDHVSAERAVSGPGLSNLYTVLCALDKISAHSHTPADITRLAIAQSDPQCREALQMFCAFLGTMAGNLALTLGATGGVYIGGGIAPALGEFFSRSDFRTYFEDKGRYRDYLARIPAWVINSETPAFVGLARSFVDPGPRVEG